MQRIAENDVNYQERATAFSVGDTVVPFGLWDSQSGRVTAVWPAIGMVDVEFPVGNRRFPVEDLQRMENGVAVPPHTDTTPAGGGTVSVPGGPYPSPKSANRVAQAFVKKSLYWTQKDRQYRMTGPETAGQTPACPKCGPDSPLKKAIYKRRDGSSDRLMGCPGCMFLIKDADIVNFGPVLADEIEIEGRAASLQSRKVQLRKLMGDVLEKLDLEPRDIRTGDYDQTRGITIRPHTGRGDSTDRYYTIEITAAEDDPAGHLRALPGGRT